MPTLVEATASQKRERDRLTASTWGKGLSLEAFSSREIALRAHPFAARGMRSWWWVDERVRSSCETFEVPAFRDGRAGRAFVVASVFTEVAERGKGHAVAMLEALSTQLAAEPNALAVVLFSEVGASIYRRAGFTLVHAHDVLLDAAPSVQAVETSEAVRGFFEPGSGVRLEVSDAQADWHAERERFYARALGRPAPRAHRARVGDSELCVVASFQLNELHVLWYRFGAAGDVEPLLRWAASEAAWCGLERVRVWETVPFSLPPGATRLERPDELPMIRPLDGGPPAWEAILRGSWA